MVLDVPMEYQRPLFVEDKALNLDLANPTQVVLLNKSVTPRLSSCEADHVNRIHDPSNKLGECLARTNE